VYVHWWGPPDAGDGPIRQWWAVVLESDGWAIDGVWLPRGHLLPYARLYRGVHFGPEQLRLPAVLAPQTETRLLDRAQAEWVAAALGGYLPDEGRDRVVKIRR